MPSITAELIRISRTLDNVRQGRSPELTRGARHALFIAAEDLRKIADDVQHLEPEQEPPEQLQLAAPATS